MVVRDPAGQALSASPTEPLCVSSLPGDGQARRFADRLMLESNAPVDLIVQIEQHILQLAESLEASSRQEERLDEACAYWRCLSCGQAHLPPDPDTLLANRLKRVASILDPGSDDYFAVQEAIVALSALPVLGVGR